MVLVSDESKVQKESGIKSIWYRKGKYPDIKVSGEKKALSFYGALNVTTGKCHVMDTQRQTSKYTVEFLRRLESCYPSKRVLLIWDGAPWHRGEVKKYLKRETEKKWHLEIMYFPPYSPDFNPQEHVWKETKDQTTKNSEEDFDTKLLKFRKYITKTKFKTNFLTKYL